jgi:ribose/xylose/arabinose/galactoside ABC-type transport system permease subunit
MKKKQYWKNIISPPAAFLFILWLLLAIFAPRFLTLRNHMNILRQAAVLILAASAQALAVIGGGMNIAVGSIATLASVVSAKVAIEFGTLLGFGTGLLVGLGLGLMLGFIIAWFKVDAVIATTGLLTVARGIAFVVSKGKPVIGVPETYRILGGSFIGPIPVSIIFSLAIAMVLMIFLTRTVWGRKIYACGLDRESAMVSGISVRKYQMITYALSVVMASVAGILLSSRINSGQATLGYDMSLESIAAVVIGGNKLFSGEGSIPKTILGVFIITILSNGMDMTNVSPYFRPIFLGLIVIGVMFIGYPFKKKKLH